MTDTRSKLLDIKRWLQSRYIEREDAAEALVVASLSREHIWFEGAPGTGKSEITVDFTRMIQARLFQQQLHPMIVPEDVFGPIDMKAFEADGKWQRTIDGYLPTAEVMILEELDKAGPAVFSPLLTAVNERRYRHGDVMIDIPLIFGVGNCNATLDDPTGAFTDRWLIRLHVDYIQDSTGFVGLLSDSLRTQPDPSPINVSDLTIAHKEVDAVTLPTPVLQVIASLRDELRANGIVPSDRRWRKSLSVVKASAWLNGHGVAELGDLAVLRHTLWLTPEQRQGVTDLVWEVAAPAMRRVKELAQAVNAIQGELAASSFGAKEKQLSWAIEQRRILPHFHRELTEIVQAERNDQVLRAADAAQRLIPEIMVRVMVDCGLQKDEVRARHEADADLAAL